MEDRQSVRAIIVHEGRLLVIHRKKHGSEFLTLPGGGIEPDETNEEALSRELLEETSVTIRHPVLVAVERKKLAFGTQFIYKASYVAGEPALKQTSDEAAQNIIGKNMYTPAWLPLGDLHSVRLLSPAIKQFVLDYLNQDTSKEVVEL